MHDVDARSHALAQRLYAEFAEFQHDLRAIDARLTAAEQRTAMMAHGMASIRAALGEIGRDFRLLSTDTVHIRQVLDRIDARNVLSPKPEGDGSEGDNA